MQIWAQDLGLYYHGLLWTVYYAKCKHKCHINCSSAIRLLKTIEKGWLWILNSKLKAPDTVSHDCHIQGHVLCTKPTMLFGLVNAFLREKHFTFYRGKILSQVNCLFNILKCKILSK